MCQDVVKKVYENAYFSCTFTLVVWMTTISDMHSFKMGWHFFPFLQLDLSIFDFLKILFEIDV